MPDKPLTESFGGSVCGYGGASIFVGVCAYSSVCGVAGGVVNTPECGWRVLGAGICEDSIKFHSSKKPSLGLVNATYVHPPAITCSLSGWNRGVL